MRGEGRGEGLPAIGSRVTHRNAPERVGTIIDLSAKCATIEYLHEREAGQAPVKTFALYNLDDLTLV